MALVEKCIILEWHRHHRICENKPCVQSVSQVLSKKKKINILELFFPQQCGVRVFLKMLCILTVLPHKGCFVFGLLLSVKKKSGDPIGVVCRVCVRYLLFLSLMDLLCIHVYFAEPYLQG